VRISSSFITLLEATAVRPDQDGIDRVRLASES
jgi:hypothetical protein